MPIDTSRVIWSAKPLPTQHLEHHGTPCTLEETEITVSGIITVTWDCTIDEPNMDADTLLSHRQSHAIEELEDALPVITMDEYGMALITQLENISLEANKAIFKIANWEHILG